MSWQNETAAVIPCLNEEVAIGALVLEVRQHVTEVCVVDDGSRDTTGQAAQRAGAHVIRHATSQGKGASLRAGWQWAHARGYRWALSLDGDGQHSPADIPSFFRLTSRTRAALTVGDRMGDSARIPPLRRLVNRWMSCQLSRLVGQSLPDSQCGFRLMNLDVFVQSPISTTHFEIESEVLVTFVRGGHRVEFVPISVIYRSEKSKISPVRDAVRWFRWWRMVRAPKSAARLSAEPAPAHACARLGVFGPAR